MKTAQLLPLAIGALALIPAHAISQPMSWCEPDPWLGAGYNRCVQLGAAGSTNDVSAVANLDTPTQERCEFHVTGGPYFIMNLVPMGGARHEQCSDMLGKSVTQPNSARMVNCKGSAPPDAQKDLTIGEDWGACH